MTRQSPRVIKKSRPPMETNTPMTCRRAMRTRKKSQAARAIKIGVMALSSTVLVVVVDCRAL